jgi:hypothetical protein
MLDFDDNILYMSSVIHLEHLENNKWVNKDISTTEFTKIRHEIKKYYDGEESEWRYINNDSNLSYSEFRDFGIRGDKAFLEDIQESIKNKKHGPIWDDFINCLIDGHLFSIITARGHEPETIKKAIEWIIYNYLSSDELNRMIKNLKKYNRLFNFRDKKCNVITHYLDSCEFIGISSKWFNDKFGVGGNSTSPEEFKMIAAEYFTKKVNKFSNLIGEKIKIGFSDDDYNTIKTMEEFFKYKLSVEYPLIDFKTYHTFKGGKYEMN